MRLLITRPQADATRLQSKLEQMGFECLLAPMLSIVAGKKVAAESPSAVIATSRHAFIGQSPINVPLYVVGEMTAKEAVKQGWPQPTFVATNSKELIESIKLPKGSTILYMRGEHISTNLASALPEYNWQEVITYIAEPAPITNSAATALAAGEVDSVLFFSKRSAELFEKECNKADLPNMHAFCLSEAIADALKLNCWSEKHVAQTPSESSLIDALNQTAIADNH